MLVRGTFLVEGYSLDKGESTHKLVDLCLVGVFKHLEVLPRILNTLLARPIKVCLCHPIQSHRQNRIPTMITIDHLSPDIDSFSQQQQVAILL